MKKTIQIHYPQNTMPISLTGAKCSLSCRHCNGHYLKSMKNISHITPLEKIPANISSFLISGGSDQNGAVPISENLDILKKLTKSGYRLNIHTGLISGAEIPLIAPYCHTVSLDFITDDETIREVYNLNRMGYDFIKIYAELKIFVPVVPHITIGLRGGKIFGEVESLEELSRMKCERIVFLVFMPTRGTAYENCSPPPLDRVDEFLHTARSILPRASFGLGCMHPRGEYKNVLEKIAFSHNFERFVNPSENFLHFLENKNVEIIIKKECCAL